MRVVALVRNVIPDSTVEYLVKFLDYVSENYNVIMMALALSVILITASAAFRSIENTIGKMQGGRRFEGYIFFVTSIVLALIFLLVLYVGIIFMFLSEGVIDYVNQKLPFVDISSSWSYLRFIILFGLALIIIILIFELCKRKEDRYSTFWGAFTATLGLDGLSYLFSRIINQSIKYPVVYSSLSSIILLMFWLYCSCQAILIGATMNVALRDCRQERQNGQVGSQ